MSLVHEALLKAAREKQRKTGAPAPPPTTPAAATPAAPAAPAPATQTPAPPATTKLPFALVASAIASVAAVAIVAIVLLVMRSAPVTQPAVKQSRPAPQAVEPSSPAEAPAPVVSVPPSPAPVPAEAPPSAAPASQPKLSGIMTDPEGKLCAILNGRVAYEGYVVDGVNVKKIERDRITIEIAGQETVLRLF